MSFYNHQIVRAMLSKRLSCLLVVYSVVVCSFEVVTDRGKAYRWTKAEVTIDNRSFAVIDDPLPSHSDKRSSAQVTRKMRHGGFEVNISDADLTRRC